MKNSRLCWINGSFFQRKDLISKIKSQVDFDKEYKIDKDFDMSLLKTILHSSGDGIFNINGDTNDETKKILIFNDFPNIKSKQYNKEWINLFKGTSENNFIIINDVKKHEYSNLWKFIRKEGKVFEFRDKLSRTEACELIKNIFRENSKSIDDICCDYILDGIPCNNKNYDYDYIVSFCTPMIIFFKSVKVVTIEKIKSNFSHIKKQYDMWDLFYLIEKKDFCELVNYYLSSIFGKSHLEAMQTIMQLTAWKYRLRSILNDLLEYKKNQNEIIDFMCSFKKKDGKQYYSEYVLRKELNDMIIHRNNQNYAYILKLANEAVYMTRNKINDNIADILMCLFFWGICYEDFSHFELVKEKLLKK